MSSRKRSFSNASNPNKASRMVGGRVLTYQPSVPVAGSFRSLGAVASRSMGVGGWASRKSSGELKFVDVTASNTLQTGGAFTAPSSTTLLNGLVPGTTATTRIGRKVVLKSLYLRWNLRLNTTTTGGTPARVIIFYDKQANAAAPAVTDLLEANTFNSQNNLSNRDRFVVLCDVVTEPVAVAGPFCVAGTIYKKLNLETMFNAGTAGTIADITSGSVYIMYAAAASATATLGPEFDWRCRIRYQDN